MAKRNSAELKIFEALESCTNNDSFCSKASFVQNFLKCELDLNNTQQSFPDESILEEDEVEIEEEDAEDAEQGEQSDNDNEGEEQDDSSSDESPTNLEESWFLDVSSILEDSRFEKGERLGERRAALLALVLQKHGTDDKLREKVVSFGGTEEREFENESEEEQDVNDDSAEASNCVNTDLEHENPKEKLIVPSKTHSVEIPDDISDSSMDSTVATYLQKLLDRMKSVELKEEELNKERDAFNKMKTMEETKLKSEKRRLDAERKNIQSLRTDCNKMKFSKEEYEDKIKQLSEQLKETKLQLNKRINRCTEQQKRLEEKVKSLEKENEELKKFQSQTKSLPQRLASLKRPPMRCIPNAKIKNNGPPRRVQFAQETNDENKENSTSKESSRLSSSLSDSSTLVESLPADNQSLDASPKEIDLSDDEADRTMPSSYVEIRHPCGTITRTTKDQKLTRHIFTNHDVMDEFEDCSVRYYYHKLGFAQTTYPNGDEIIEYDSGEIETKRADGSKIYTYTDGLVKMIDGHSKFEEVIFSDGSVVKRTPSGETTVTWPSGQKEVRTEEFVKRIYTNGTVKIMYKDGSEETRYWNGRVRRKDKTGVLVDDTKKSKSLKH